jgi:hypothetical protein
MVNPTTIELNAKYILFRVETFIFFKKKTYIPSIPETEIMDSCYPTKIVIEDGL